jgi:hypothetical protein
MVLATMTWQAVERAGGMEMRHWAIGRAGVGHAGGWQGVQQW